MDAEVDEVPLGGRARRATHAAGHTVTAQVMTSTRAAVMETQPWRAEVAPPLVDAAVE